MERINNSHIEGIQNEYRRINSKWLRMHFRLLLWLVAFTTAMETAMYLRPPKILCNRRSSTV